MQFTAFRSRLSTLFVGAIAITGAFMLIIASHLHSFAQVTNCTLQNLNHVNCSTGTTSAPDQGKWAWNPGDFSQFAIPGNTHWWIDWKWTTQGRVTEFIAQDNPRIHIDFFDGGDDCGCGNINAIAVRTVGHRNAPPKNSFDANPRPGDCSGQALNNFSKIVVRFKNTSFATLNTEFDLSVDANMVENGDPGEANLSWTNDFSFSPDCTAWLGKVKYCDDGTVKACEPSGICCSTSSFSPNCAWDNCP